MIIRFPLPPPDPTMMRNFINLQGQRDAVPWRVTERGDADFYGRERGGWILDVLIAEKAASFLLTMGLLLGILSGIGIWFVGPDIHNVTNPFLPVFVAATTGASILMIVVGVAKLLPALVIAAANLRVWRRAYGKR
jgi:hypothetical protein